MAKSSVAELQQKPGSNRSKRFPINRTKQPEGEDIHVDAVSIPQSVAACTSNCCFVFSFRNYNCFFNRQKIKLEY